VTRATGGAGGAIGARREARDHLVLLLGLLVLWRIAEHLKAIRSILANMAALAQAQATHDTAERAAFDLGKIRKVLERAVRKQWGNAIDWE
jgi:hypothetical protein